MKTIIKIDKTFISKTMLLNYYKKKVYTINNININIINTMTCNNFNNYFDS